jgi:hypothetical protein
MSVEIAAVLIGSAVTLVIALGTVLYTAGRFSGALESLADKIQGFGKTFDGLHRRLTEQDAALDSIRSDLSAMRLELEMKGTLREKTKA